MEIKYYTNNLGHTPVLKYLDKLSDRRHRRQILEDIELLSDFGLERFKQTVDAEKLAGTKNIWELRTRCLDNIIYRTLFSADNGQIIILNIFNKKEQKIRRQEIAKAINRLNN